MTNHVIWAGDSRELAGQLPDGINCICTDPPYGMAYVSNRAVTPDGKARNIAIASDGDIDTAIETFRGAVAPMLPKLAEQAEMYVFCRWDFMERWRQFLDGFGPFRVHDCLVWSKEAYGMGDVVTNWAPSHEFILYAKAGKRPLNTRRLNVLTFDRPHHNDRFHPTEKPVALLERLIEVSTAPGDLVVDPFAGSGSTIVAARNLNRRGIGIEVNDEYARKARGRLEQMLLF